MDRSQVHAEGRLEVRGLELEVRMEAGGSSLNVEVQDPYSGDCWRADFQPSYVEDLTHKTGNFKQFSVFCSMLESAITQSSESVSLDLLTYANLERMRSRKGGPAMRSALHPSTAATTTPSGAANPALNSKRYLILIYTVEFDRIHYPLALGYAGRPDTATLQRAVRQLKEELSHLRGHPGVVQDHKHRELESLQRDKRELEALVARLQKRAEGGGCGGASDAGVVGATAAKELRVLRRLVSSLQEELGRERAKAQRLAAKRSQEIRRLNDELEEARASERSLRARVKCLSTELALYKRGRVTPVLPPAERSRGSERAASGGPGRARGEVRSTSRERERRTASREGRPPVRGPHLRTPSLSPAAGRVPAFDPTAYVREREQRKKEAELRGSRQRRRELQGTPGSGGSSGGRGRPRSRPPSGGRALNGQNTRSSSLESAHSRRSSAGSGSDAAPFSEPLTSATTHRRGGKAVKKSSWESPAEPKRGRAERRRQLASTPTATQPADTMTYYSQSADLSEIDARLDALQDYMRALEAHK
ncbi:centrosomal protein CCDC61 isoform X1 [Lethenteron reissneri]|uniref:centrosomal protein CCDC61 isoform X1 n=1 Tax=Lethenteron reissneri TaxID=7753 RepID=UPI002AB6BD53|nr:centrosomal protein CCDC61 isoform X1 [Lethenteron reissneri]